MINAGKHPLEIRFTNKKWYKLSNTLCNSLRHLVAFSCARIHSIAMSYSIVLGCEQCEVETAFFWKDRKERCNQLTVSRKFNIKQFWREIIITISSRCICNLILSICKWPVKVGNGLGICSMPLLQKRGLQVKVIYIVHQAIAADKKQKYFWIEPTWTKEPHLNKLKTCLKSITTLKILTWTWILII